MNTFTWLIIGHLVGDWLLQNDWMATDKRKGLLTSAGMTHFIIYTVITMGAFWLAQGEKIRGSLFLGLTLLVFVSHWLIDATSLVDYWIRVYRQSDKAIMRIMVDQTLHLLVLAIVAYIEF